MFAVPARAAALSLTGPPAHFRFGYAAGKSRPSVDVRPKPYFRGHRRSVFPPDGAERFCGATTGQLRPTCPASPAVIWTLGRRTADRCPVELRPRPNWLLPLEAAAKLSYPLGMAARLNAPAQCCAPLTAEVEADPRLGADGLR